MELFEQFGKEEIINMIGEELYKKVSEKTDLEFTYEIGSQRGQSKTVTIKQNETFTFKVTFTSDGTVSGSFVNLKLKKPALGTIVMNNIHFIGLGE